MITTKLIDKKKLKDSYTKEELEKKYNKTHIEVLTYLIDLEENVKLLENSNLLNYQNTNYENYAFIIKDLFKDVNKSTSTIIESIIILFKELKEFLVTEPMLCGVKISYDEEKNIIINESVIPNYIKYLNNVNYQLSVIRNYLKNVNKDIDLLEEFDNIVKDDYFLDEITKDNLYKTRLHSVRHTINMLLSKKLNSILKKSLETEVYEAINFFVKEDERVFSNNYISSNLADEKIISKESLVFYCEIEDIIKFEIIAPNSFNQRKNSYTYKNDWFPDFEISYYVKKYLIETYTKKDMFKFMCISKDFLFTYAYKNMNEEKKRYNQKHPSIIESNLANEISKKTEIVKDRYLNYINILKDVKKEENTLFLSKNINEWITILNLPNKSQFKFKEILKDSKEPLLEDVLNAINNITSNGMKYLINTILDDNDKIKIYKNYEKAEYFIYEAVEAIYTKLYTIDNMESNNTKIDYNSFFKKRDRANFHTVLKDSLVYDFRDEVLKINSNVEEFERSTEENTKISNELKEILKTHKYHDYIEIDKDALKKDSKININKLIELLKLSNKYYFPVSCKSAIKLRKLGNYNAKGIYFSFSKNIGLDFRYKHETYIHEKAHHIDLNNINSNVSTRKKIYSLLLSYFNHRIHTRREYYLSIEELIAHTAEVMLILLIGRYKQFKEFYDRKEINEETLIYSIKKTFEKSKYSLCMGSWDYYKTFEYINIEEEILNNNFNFLDILVEYYYHFWKGDLSSINKKRFSSIQAAVNENKFFSKKDYSYNYSYKDIYNINISKDDNFDLVNHLSKTILLETL